MQPSSSKWHPGLSVVTYPVAAVVLASPIGPTGGAVYGIGILVGQAVTWTAIQLTRWVGNMEVSDSFVLVISKFFIVICLAVITISAPFFTGGQLASMYGFSMSLKSHVILHLTGALIGSIALYIGEWAQQVFPQIATRKLHINY